MFLVYEVETSFSLLVRDFVFKDILKRLKNEKKEREISKKCRNAGEIYG